MSVTVRTLVISCSLLLGACADESAQTSAPTADAAPATTEAGSAVAAMIAAASADPATTTYQDLQGNGFDVAAFAGKKVFLNYWATWCAPCIREIPAISRAADALESEDFVFLLASDESPEKISGFLAERGFEGNFVKLNGYFGSHGIDAVPSSLLYDANGNLVKTWAGAYEWDSAEMLAEIRGAVQ